MGYETDHGKKQENYKKKVMSIVQSKGLCSMMNNTKWRELKKGVAALPFQPPFVMKTVDEEETEYHRFDEDAFHFGEWGLYLDNYLGGDVDATPFWAVEWIKVRPRYKKARGRLVPDEIIDATKDFLSVLEKYNIPFEESNGAYIIYGYRGSCREVVFPYLGT